MAAPVGNQFWRLRERDGRYPKIQDANKLWELALEYFTWIDENPLTEIDYRGKDATPVTIFKRRPYQKDGFALYCQYSSWRDIKYLEKQGEDFSQILSRIEQIIEGQMKEGALVGQFKESLTARILGLHDTIKTDQIKPISITIQTESDDTNTA